MIDGASRKGEALIVQERHPIFLYAVERGRNLHLGERKMKAVKTLQEAPLRVLIVVVHKVDGAFLFVDRFEEGKALHVITVHVGEDNINRLVRSQEFVSKAPDARAGIDNEKAVLRLNGHAGGVAPVALILRGGGGDGAPCAPTGDLHGKRHGSPRKTGAISRKHKEHIGQSKSGEKQSFWSESRAERFLFSRFLGVVSRRLSMAGHRKGHAARTAPPAGQLGTGQLDGDFFGAGDEGTRLVV